MFEKHTIIGIFLNELCTRVNNCIMFIMYSIIIVSDIKLFVPMYYLFFLTKSTSLTYSGKISNFATRRIWYS